MEDREWQPLTDIWELYHESLQTAVEQGHLDDPDLAQTYVWPEDLNFGEWEQKDVQRYVHERITEIVDGINRTGGGVNPNMIAGYIFRSVLCGMLWERERVGK